MSDSWTNLWNERGSAVQKVLGASFPNGTVLPYNWTNYILPGACGLTFPPNASRITSAYMYMSLGLTQPLSDREKAWPWEFTLFAKSYCKWPHQIIYDLLTYWLAGDKHIGRGRFFPCTYFLNKTGIVCAGLTDEIPEITPIGNIRGIFLWDDIENLKFPVSNGTFGLMGVSTVTLDEHECACKFSPHHLLLLLRSFGLMQMCDPFRDSVFTMSGAVSEWKRIQHLSDSETIAALSVRSDT